jgi:hypothetical protein
MPPRTITGRRRPRVPTLNRPHNDQSRKVRQQSPSNQEGTRHLLGALSSLLVLIGVLLYGCLSLIYTSFYQALGINVSDVGLNYAIVLSQATGYVLLVLLFFGLITLISVVNLILRSIAFELKDRQRGTPLELLLKRGITEGGRNFLRNTLGENQRKWPVNTAAAILILLVAFSFTLSARAGGVAASVRSGSAVIPSETLNLRISGVRADPVQVSPAGKLTEAPQVDALAVKNDLLYLGQAGGTVVLYDPAQRQAIWLFVMKRGARCC